MRYDDGDIEGLLEREVVRKIQTVLALFLGIFQPKNIPAIGYISLEFHTLNKHVDTID